MKNKYINLAKISEDKFRQLLKGFLDFYEEYKNAVYYYDEEPEKFEKMQEDFENYRIANYFAFAK